MIDESARILSIRPLAQGYQVLTLAAPAIAAEAQPGQFVHVRVPSLDAARLRRPFSIYDADPMTGRLHILYKTVGLGTRHLAALPVGTELPVLGPIGRPFPLKPEGTPYLIGGGYGVAPLWFLASRLPRKGILFVGGRTAADERAIDAGIKGWLSLDKHMVCGVGACLACVQKIRREDGSEVLARVCVDGPVFEAREIVW